MPEEEFKEISSYTKEQSSSTEKSVELNNEFKCYTFDLETTALTRDSEIIQIACASVNDSANCFSAYSVTDGDVSFQASSVNKLQISFSSGRKVLLKDYKVVASDVSCQDALTNFV